MTERIPRHNLTPLLPQRERIPLMTHAATAERHRMAREDPGYATENVRRLVDDDTAELHDILAAATPGHSHDGYGWRGCVICRRVEAERVALRFGEACE